MKRIAVIVVAAVFALALAGCAGALTSDSKSITLDAPSQPAGGETIANIALEGGQRLDLEYDISDGSFDLVATEQAGWVSYDGRELTGKGFQTIATGPGTYQVTLTAHDVVGKATVVIA